MSEEVDFAETLRAKRPEPSPIKPADLLSTGSTTLNLACSGRRSGGVPKGAYVLLAGDTDSGKTWLARTLLAEASINPEFDEYRLIYNNRENGSLMDIGRYFGQRLVDRIEERSSPFVEDFYYDLDDDLDDDRPFIQILDSMDGLASREDEKLFDKKKAQARAPKKKGAQEKDAGSYGTAKPKANSANLRIVADRLREKGSILVILAQLRAQIGTFVQFGPPPKDLTGGISLKYYAHLVLWTSIKESVKRKYKGKDREIGNKCAVRIKRNRLTGRKRSVIVPIYHSIGIDDTGACIEYLVEEKHWKMQGGGERNSDGTGIVTAKEFNLTGTVDELAKQIEASGKDKQLRVIVTRIWNEIETAMAVTRRNRYAVEEEDDEEEADAPEGGG